MRGYYQSQGCTKQLWEVSIRNGERFAEHGYRLLRQPGKTPQWIHIDGMVGDWDSYERLLSKSGWLRNSCGK